MHGSSTRQGRSACAEHSDVWVQQVAGVTCARDMIGYDLYLTGVCVTGSPEFRR